MTNATETTTTNPVRDALIATLNGLQADSLAAAQAAKLRDAEIMEARGKLGEILAQEAGLRINQHILIERHRGSTYLARILQLTVGYDKCLLVIAAKAAKDGHVYGGAIHMGMDGFNGKTVWNTNWTIASDVPDYIPPAEGESDEDESDPAALAGKN